MASFPSLSLKNFCYALLVKKPFILIGFLLFGFGSTCKKKEGLSSPAPSQSSTNSQVGKKLQEEKPQVPKQDPPSIPQIPTPENELILTQEKPISLRQSIELINEAVQTFVEEERKGNLAPCSSIAAQLKQGLWGGELPISVNKKTEQAFKILAICSSTNHQWLTTLQAVNELLQAKTKFAFPFLKARALIYLSAFDEAETVLKELLQKDAKNPEVTYTTALFFSKIKNWEDCVFFLDQTLELLKTLTKEQDDALLNFPLDIRIDTLFMKIDALYHLGKFEEAKNLILAFFKENEASLQQAKSKNQNINPFLRIQNELQYELKRNELTNKTKIIVEPDLGNNAIYLSTYQFSVEQRIDVRPLLLLRVSNFDQQIREIDYEAEIEGMTLKESPKGKSDLLLNPGETKVFRIAPPLSLAFTQNAITSPTPVYLSLKVSSEAKDSPDRTLFYQDQIRLRVYPKHYLPLAQRFGADVFIPTLGFLGPWITPQAEEIDTFLQVAKKRAPDTTFAGQQQATFFQVKALYDELKARGFSYVMDPGVLSDLQMVQKIRYPAEVLKSTNAQCLEGSLLFASLFKAFQLEAALVKIPGHIFVGWKATKQDLENPKLKSLIAPNGFFYLETTLVHTADFQDAVKVGLKEVLKEQEVGHFSKNLFSPSVFISLKELEEKGFLNL